MKKEVFFPVIDINYKIKITRTILEMIYKTNDYILIKPIDYLKATREVSTQFN